MKFTATLFFQAIGAACLVFLFATTSISCSDDDHGPLLTPTLPCTTANAVRSVEHIGSVPETYDWTLTYKHGRLVQGHGVLRDPDTSKDKSYNYTSSLNYGHNNTMGIRNSDGADTEIQLNGYGLIEKMTVGRNTYEFSYQDNRLARWKITLYEGSFGQNRPITSTGNLEYVDGDLMRITYEGPEKKPIVLNFTSSTQINSNGLLPETASMEMGLMGYEHLYYAGLFGSATRHLPASIARHFTEDPGRDYTTYFEYGLQNGNVELCSYMNGNQSAAAMYSY